MSPLFRIPLGIVISVIGFYMVYKTDTFREWFGEIPWAEDHLGPGGTRLFYKILGVLVCTLGIFVVTNIIDGILAGVAGIFVRQPF